MFTSVCWRLRLRLSLAEELFDAFHSFLINSLSLISILRGLIGIGPLPATSDRLTASINWLDLGLQSPNGLFVFKLASHITGNI